MSAASWACVIAATCTTAACTRDHHVELWLGSSATEVSAGFECKKSATELLFDDAAHTEADGVHLQFAVVVDLIELGGLAPMCLAEDIVGTCNANPATCSIVHRACVWADVPLGSGSGSAAQVVEDWLHAHASQLIEDAPTVPVLIRVVAALPPGGNQCPAIPQNGGFVGDEILGCAASCVIQLQDVSSVTIGLDVEGDLSNPIACQAAIGACASFPTM